MATAISKANFEAACGECYDAIGSQDWANAYLYFAQAEAQLAGLEVQGGEGGASYRLHDSLEKLGNALDKASAAVGKHSGNSRLIKFKTDFSTSR